MSAALRELLAKAKFGEFSVSGTGFLLEGKHMFGDGVYGDAAPALAALINEAPALLAKSAAYDALVGCCTELAVKLDRQAAENYTDRGNALSRCADDIRLLVSDDRPSHTAGENDA